MKRKIILLLSRILRIKFFYQLIFFLYNQNIENLLVYNLFLLLSLNFLFNYWNDVFWNFFINLTLVFNIHNLDTTLIYFYLDTYDLQLKNAYFASNAYFLKFVLFFIFFGIFLDCLIFLFYLKLTFIPLNNSCHNLIASVLKFLFTIKEIFEKLFFLLLLFFFVIFLLILIFNLILEAFLLFLFLESV